MIRLEQLKQSIRQLSPEELAAFRDWFQQYDNELWERQIEEDALSGKLDRLADNALADHKAGKTTPV